MASKTTWTCDVCGAVTERADIYEVSTQVDGWMGAADVCGGCVPRAADVARQKAQAQADSVRDEPRHSEEHRGWLYLERALAEKGLSLDAAWHAAVGHASEYGDLQAAAEILGLLVDVVEMVRIDEGLS